MRSLKKQDGFTIIELLIVIVVIGILATLVIVAYSGIQQSARNEARKTDINAIQAQLEAYFTNNATYPTRDQLNNTSNWRTTNMPGLDAEALKDPAKNSPTTLAASAGANVYAYTFGPSACDGTSANPCTEYTLTATLEGGDTYVKESLN